MQTCFRSFLPVSVPSQQQPVPAMQMEYYESQQNLLNQRNQQSMGLCNTHSFAQPSQTSAVWFPCSTGYVLGASGSVRKPPPNVTVCSSHGSAHIRGPTEIVRHPNSPLQQKMSSTHYANYNAMWTNSCNNNAVPGFKERSHGYSALPPWHHSAPTIHPTTGLQQQTAQSINVNHVQINAVGNGTPYCNTSQPLALRRPVRMLPPSKLKTSSSQSQMNCELNQISSRQPAPSKTFASCRQSYKSSSKTICMSQPPPPPYRPRENLVPLKRTLSQGSTSVPQDVTRPQAMLAANQHSKTSPHSIQYIQPQAIHSDISSSNPTVKNLTSCSTSQVQSPASSNVLSAPLLCMLLEMDKKQLQDLTSFDNCRNRKQQLSVQKGGSQKSTQDQTHSQTTTMVDQSFIFHNSTTQNTTEGQRVNEYRAAAKGVGVSRVNVIGPGGPERSNTDKSQPGSQFDNHTRPTSCQNSPDCNYPTNTPEAATLQRDGQQVYKAVAVVSPVSQQLFSQRQVYLLAPSTEKSPPLKQGADKTFVKITDSPNESNTTGALSVLNPHCKTPTSGKASDLECTSQISTISQSPVCITDHPPKILENGDCQVKQFCSNDAELDLPKLLVRDVTLETVQELTRSLEGTQTDTGKVLNVIKCILDLFWDGKVANMIKVKSTVMYLIKASSKFHERNSHAVVFQHLDTKHLELLADRYQVLESKVTFSSEKFTSSWLNVDGKPADVDGVLAEPVSDLAWCTNVSLPGSNSTGQVVDSHVAQADSNDTTDLRANVLSDNISNSKDIAIPSMPGPLSEEVFMSVATQSQIKMMSVKNELSNPLLFGNGVEDDVSKRQEMAKVTLDSQGQEVVSMFHKDFSNQAVEENEPAKSTSCITSFEQVDSNNTADLRANVLSDDISNSKDIAIPSMPGPLSEEVFMSVATQSQIKMMSVKNELSNPLLFGNGVEDDVSKRQEMAKVTLDSQGQEVVSMFHKDFSNQAVEENEPAKSTSCITSFEQVDSNNTADLRANVLSDDISNSKDIAIPSMPGPLSEEVFMSVATQSQIKMMSVKNELSNPLLFGNGVEDDVSKRQEMAKVTLDSQGQEVVSMFHKDFSNQAVEENEPAKSTSCITSFEQVDSNNTADLRANVLSDDISNSKDIAIPSMPGPLSEEVFMSVATQSQIKMMSVKNELSNPLLFGNGVEDDVSKRQEMAKVTLDSQGQEVVSMFHKDFSNQAVEENEPAKSTSCNTSFHERVTKYAVVKGICHDICPVEENFMEITLLSSEDARKLSKGLAKIHQPIEPPQLSPFFLNSLDPNPPSNIKFACPHMTDMVGVSDFFCSSCWNKTPLLVLDLDEYASNGNTSPKPCDPGQSCGSLHGMLLKDPNASACLESSSVSRVNTTVDECVSRENMYGNPRAKELRTSATKTIAEELCSVTSSGTELKTQEVPRPTKNEQNAKPMSPFQTKTLAETPSTPWLSHCKVHFFKTSGVPTDDIFSQDLLKKKSNCHKQPPGDTFGNNSESCRMKRKGNQEDACSPIKITIQLKQHSSPTGQDSYRTRKKPPLKRHHVPSVMGTVHCRNGLPHKPKRPYFKKKKHDGTKAVSQNKGVKKVRFELFGTSRCSSVNRDSERSLSTPVYLSISASQGDANYSDGLSAKQKVYSDWSSKFVHKQKATPFKLSQKQINTELKSKIELLKLTLNDRMTGRDKQSRANQKRKRVARGPPNAPKPKKLKGATADDV